MASSVTACNCPGLVPSLYQKTTAGSSSHVFSSASSLSIASPLAATSRRAALHGSAVRKAAKGMQGKASRKEIQGTEFLTGHLCRSNEGFNHESRRLMRIAAEPDGKQTDGSSAPSTMADAVKEGVEAMREGVASSPMADAVKEGVEAMREGVVSAMDSPELQSALERVSLVGEISGDAIDETTSGQLVDIKTAATTVAFWVAAAAAFGLGIGIAEGSGKASQFLAGYLLELSLSVDNLFVFVLVFDYFQVPTAYQSKVLSYGIAGAVFFRAILIGAGLSAVQAFESINLLFAAVLLFSSFKLLSEGDDEEEDLSNNFIVQFCRKLIPVTDTYKKDNFFTIDEGIKKATPLLLTLAVIELTDIFFAFDSIPAIFGVTQDPFIVFTSNIFAILGLRSLFTVIASSMADLRFLQPAIAAILGFIGAKLLADYFGYEIPTEASLLVVFTFLSGGIFLSLRFPKEEKDEGL